MTFCLVRLLRGWRLDRNPLRRLSDRAETVAGIVLLAAFAAAVPLTARAAAAGTRALAAHTRAAELATRREVTAITLERAAAVPATQYVLVTQRLVYAVWTAPDGGQRVGAIRVWRSTPRGARERIWVSGDGGVAAPPLAVAEIARLADCAAAGDTLGLIVFFLFAGKLTRCVIDRRRMAAWDTEWAVTEPRWNHLR